MRIVAETAGAIDRLIVRVRAAAHGELEIALDKHAREELPDLVESIDRLLARVRSSLNSFNDLAMHDSVTGLPNRLHLRREAERSEEHTYEIQSLRRNSYDVLCRKKKITTIQTHT